MMNRSVFVQIKGLIKCKAMSKFGLKKVDMLIDLFLLEKSGNQKVNFYVTCRLAKMTDQAFSV